MVPKIDKRAIKSRITKETLFECATQLFKIKGYNKTKIEDIAKAANVSVGAFYFHFHSKEDLVFIWADEIDKKYQEHYNDLVLKSPNIKPLEIIEKMVTLSLTLFSLWGAEFAAVTYSYMMRNPVINDRMVNPGRIFNKIIKELVVLGQQQKSIRDDFSPDEMVKIITKIIRGMILDWCINGEKNNILEISEPCIRSFLDGIKA